MNNKLLYFYNNLVPFFCLVGVIQKGMENGSLLKVNSYPYWNSNGSGSGNIPYRYKFLSLPTFTFSSIDSIQQLEERTKVFNNTLRILI